MKLLTPAEHAELLQLAAPGDTDLRDEAERELLWILVEQGRAGVSTETRDDPDDESMEIVEQVYSITSAGREALRLWPAIEAALCGSAATAPGGRPQ